MKEELIRIENGLFLHESTLYRFDVEVSKGECIGIFADTHEYDGTAYEGIFSGTSVIQGGKAFAFGKRVSYPMMNLWIRDHVVRLNRNRFTAKESTVRDFLLFLGPGRWRKERNLLKKRLASEEAVRLLEQMKISASFRDKLTGLSVTEYYKLAVFRAWLWGYSIMVLDRLSEILPSQDLDCFMDCVQILQGRGIGCVMLELNEDFLFRYASRVDILQNRKLCYRLEPDEYDSRLYKILGWKMLSGKGFERETIISEKTKKEKPDASKVFVAENLTFEGLEPMNFVLRKGDIALYRDENLQFVPLLKKCIFENQNWTAGEIWLDGEWCNAAKLRKKIGFQIGVQTELPDRRDGILFENLSGLENIYDSLIPKSGRRLIRKKTVDSIRKTAEEAFSREMLARPVKEWSHPDRLRLIYYRWYLLNPKLLICMMPFSGQEAAHHEMIIDLLVRCARRGMAILLISSGADGIYEKTENQEFRERLFQL